MTDNPRTEIIARVRRASARQSGKAVEEALQKLGYAPSSTIAAEDLLHTFMANVEGNHGSAIRVDNKSEAAKAVANYLYQRYYTRKLVAGNDPKLAAMPWRDGAVLPRFGAAIDGDAAAVSYASMAVAETGSVVLCSGKSNPASNHLLVDDHIVLIDADTLVATMEEAWQGLAGSHSEGRRQRAVYFISGPSSSADIDFQVVTGAHGPRHWHTIIIGRPAPATAVQNSCRQ